MSANGYGPSLSDQGFGPEDACVGDCVRCTTPLDAGDFTFGTATSDSSGRLVCGQCATLTFAALRAANVARLPLFKNKRGGPAHSQPDGSDWSLGEWCSAVLGELGEAANLIKKVQRGDITLDEARGELAKEYADVVTYLDILAFRTGVDLGEATAAKWDEVSARVGVKARIVDFTEVPT